MDIHIVALVSLTVIIVALSTSAVFISRYAFASDAGELGKGESAFILRLSTVFIVILAGVFFAVFNQLKDAIPFLAPVAAFVLGGIKTKK